MKLRKIESAIGVALLAGVAMIPATAGAADRVVGAKSTMYTSGGYIRYGILGQNTGRAARGGFLVEKAFFYENGRSTPESKEMRVTLNRSIGFDSSLALDKRDVDSSYDDNFHNYSYKIAKDFVVQINPRWGFVKDDIEIEKRSPMSENPSATIMKDFSWNVGLGFSQSAGGDGDKRVWNPGVDVSGGISASVRVSYSQPGVRLRSYVNKRAHDLTGRSKVDSKIDYVHTGHNGQGYDLRTDTGSLLWRFTTEHFNVDEADQELDYQLVRDGWPKCRNGWDQLLDADEINGPNAEAFTPEVSGLWRVKNVNEQADSHFLARMQMFVKDYRLRKYQCSWYNGAPDRKTHSVQGVLKFMVRWRNDSNPSYGS